MRREGVGASVTDIANLPFKCCCSLYSSVVWNAVQECSHTNLRDIWPHLGDLYQFACCSSSDNLPEDTIDSTEISRPLKMALVDIHRKD